VRFATKQGRHDPPPMLSATPRHYDFDSQLQWSRGHVLSPDRDVRQLLRAEIHGAVHIQPATEREDRQGTDWWVLLSNKQWLSVDVKRQRVDPLTFRRPRDTLPLETWSVLYGPRHDLRGVKVGWTRDAQKRTDYVLWTWPTGRWCLIPFRLLCRVFDERWQAWRVEYATSVQFTPGGTGGGRATTANASLSQRLRCGRISTRSTAAARVSTNHPSGPSPARACNSLSSSSVSLGRLIRSSFLLRAVTRRA